jgi:hypothetical protein|tara:strand:- start:8415 stop:8726 length:312 start_codon:yes stop_codon:yes gene_type:complete
MALELSHLQKERLRTYVPDKITRRVKRLTEALDGTFMISYNGVPYGLIEIQGHPLYSICWFQKRGQWKVFIGASLRPPFNEQEKVWLPDDNSVVEYFDRVRSK